MMDDWHKAKRIFADAMKVAPAERSAFPDEVCKGDAETRREVESSLASLDDAESFTMIYNGLGNTDKALEWLEKAFEQRDPKMVFLKVEPKWNNLRSEPRFIALIKRMDFE